MEEDLQPCPFCRETLGLEFEELSPDVDIYVFCTECGAKGPFGDTHEDAMLLWNRRLKGDS